MPFVTIQMWEGRSAEQKAKVIAKVTEAVAESMEVKPEYVTVLLQEYSKANWGMGGKPSSEVFPDEGP